MATKKIFSGHSEESDVKSSHFNGEECFDNKLKDVQKSLQQNIVYTSELPSPQKSALSTKETRFVKFLAEKYAVQIAMLMLTIFCNFFCHYHIFSHSQI